MLVSSAYELKDKNRIELLRKYLDCYPDTPYANRIYSLLASCYFYEGKYDEALALFNSTRLDLLGNEERDDRTYQLATCYMKTDNLKEAAIWFETLRASSPKYAKAVSYTHLYDECSAVSHTFFFDIYTQCTAQSACRVCQHRVFDLTDTFGSIMPGFVYEMRRCV